MKIYTSSQITQDLSRFTDEDLELFNIPSREDAQLPIKIHSFEFSLNEDGYVVITFGSKNHKYLDVRYNTSTNLRFYNDYKDAPFRPRGLNVETQDRVQYGAIPAKPPYLRSPVSHLTIWLEPDNEKECEIIDGAACVLTCGWQYEIVIVPFEKFRSKQDREEDLIGDLNEDELYIKDIFSDD
jgi:hypothetical protein